MSSGKSAEDDASLEAFLARKSPLSADYASLDPTEPPAGLDGRVLAAARAGIRQTMKQPPAGVPASPASPGSGPQAAPAPKRAAARRKEPAADHDAEVDADDDRQAARRPRWLLPAAIAASVVAAVGVGFVVLDSSPAVKEGRGGMASLFARRARERGEADRANSEAATAREAIVAEEVPPPSPPPVFFEFEGPQVDDLDSAIAMIRREMVLVNQREASGDSATPAAESAAPPEAGTAAPASAPSSLIQPRERRLAKILQLYDDGNPYLAEDALEIFLRDFADDPVSQRILGVKP